MVWFSGKDLRLDFYSNGSIKELLLKGQSIWAIGDSYLPTLELAIRVGQCRVVVQPHIPADNVRTAGLSLAVNFDTCVDSHGSETWSISGRYTMEVAEDGSIDWRVHIRNDCPHPICEVLYPRTMPVYLSPTGALMYPHHAGERIENVPHALASDKYQRFWRAESIATDFGFAREINYCGLASMTWMDISDESGGMYVGSHDPSFPVTGLRIETGGPDDPWVSLSIRKYVDIPSGGCYDSPEIVWAFHRGDWHPSAHRYRQWFDTVLKQAKHPDDLGEEVLLSPHYNFRRFEGIGYRFEDIPAIAKQDREEFQSRHFFVAGWNHMGFDSHYPNYNPDLELGTPLVLQRGVNSVNDSGGFVTFYINSRIMDKHSEYAGTIGEKWMLRTLEQHPIEERYGPAETFVLCPSHPAWRKHLLEFAIWMCQAYGARGIYYDQLGSATPYPCYSDHDHQHLGTTGFNQGYIDLLEETYASLKEIRSDSFLMIENCGDVYSSRVWGSLAWNGEFYDECFNLYKYTFPEHTLINMVNPRRMDDPDQQEMVFYQDLTRAFVLGSVFWFEGTAFRNRISDSERRERMLTKLHEALSVRRAIAVQLRDAVFKDDLGLTLPPGVLGTIWELPERDGGLVLLVNSKNQRGSIRLSHCWNKTIIWKVFDSRNNSWVQATPQEKDGDLVVDVPLGTFGAFSWFKP